MNESNITESEVLNLAWSYFSLLAQQRLTYFNFFIVLMGVISTALVTSFQEKLDVHVVGIGLGLIEAFLCFTFWKIDERNKYLTKHMENVIKYIEHGYKCEEIKIFTTEEIMTAQLRNVQNNHIFTKQLSHSQLHKMFYIVFSTIGILGAIVSLVLQISK